MRDVFCIKHLCVAYFPQAQLVPRYDSQIESCALPMCTVVWHDLLQHTCLQELSCRHAAAVLRHLRLRHAYALLGSMTSPLRID